MAMTPRARRAEPPPRRGPKAMWMRGSPLQATGDRYSSDIVTILLLLLIVAREKFPTAHHEALERYRRSRAERQSAHPHLTLCCAAPVRSRSPTGLLPG